MKTVKAVVKTVSTGLGDAANWLGKPGNLLNAAVTAATAIGQAAKAVGAFITELFACAGKTATSIGAGWGIKFSSDGVNGVGMSLGMTIGSSASSMTNLLTGKGAPNFGFVFTFVLGLVPFGPDTGGLRSGIGIAASVTCSASGCFDKLQIDVGFTAAGLFPLGDILCTLYPFMGVAKCFVSAGILITLTCCKVIFATGKSECR